MNSATTPAPDNSRDSLPSASAATLPGSANSSTRSTPTPAIRTWRGWWKNARWPVILTTTATLVIGGIIYFYNTMVVGTEINSQTWEVREFSFRQDPFTHAQLTQIRYQPSLLAGGSWIASAGTVSLIDPAIKGFLTSKPIEPERWDLVRLYDRYDTIGRGSILVRLVNVSGIGSSRYWVDWSNNEPAKAAVLWPAAQQLVNLGLYGDLPALFDHAAIEKDDTKFQNAVAALMHTTLLEIAQQKVKSGDTKVAIDIANLGLSYGDHPALQAIVEQKP